MKVVLILNGEILDYEMMCNYVGNKDYIIACDGGLRHCREMDITPNIIIGDFDSVDDELLELFRGKSIALKYPHDKDFTDGELGVQKAIQFCEQNDCDEVIILGGISENGRFDHVLSNVFMLRMFEEKNISSRMVTEKNEIYYTTMNLIFKPSKKFLSIIPVSDVLEIESAKGLKYNLDNEVFYFGSTRSLSNECVDEVINISIKGGKALIVLSND